MRLKRLVPHSNPGRRPYSRDLIRSKRRANTFPARLFAGEKGGCGVLWRMTRSWTGVARQWPGPQPGPLTAPSALTHPLTRLPLSLNRIPWRTARRSRRRRAVLTSPKSGRLFSVRVQLLLGYYRSANEIGDENGSFRSENGK